MRSAEVGSPIVASTPAPSTTNVSGSSLLPNIFLCELVAIEVLDALGSIGQYLDIAAADVECAVGFICHHFVVFFPFLKAVVMRLSCRTTIVAMNVRHEIV